MQEAIPPISARQAPSFTSTVRPLRDGIVAALIVLIAAAAGDAIMYRGWMRAAQSQVAGRLMDVAEAAATAADAEFHRTCEGVQTPGSSSLDLARRPLERLLRAEPGIAFIHTSVLRNNQVVRVLDVASDAASQQAGRVTTVEGLEVDSSPLLSLAIADHVAECDPESVALGAKGYVAAYAPIVANDGTVTGCVTVGQSGAKYAQELAWIKSSALEGTLFGVVLAAAVGIAVWWLRARSARDERRLAETIADLATARDRAEQADRIKSDFLATMSHEIRTPMNGIIGMNSFLLETKLDTEQREYASTVSSCAESLLALINDVLDYSKIEAGKLDIESIEFDLHLSIEETTNVLAARAEEKRIELIHSIDPAVPALVMGDPVRVRQVLLNLAGNAVKFTEKGEVLVRVTQRSREGDRALMLFEVLDTGIGIPPERMDRLFQVFTQVDSSTTRKYGGTGLGLAISKRLVEAMGGEIGVENRPERGTRFWFTIPMQVQPETAETMRRLVATQLVGQRVLIVDDNATNRQVVMSQTRSWGLVCDATESPIEALELLRRAVDERRPYVMAFLDYQMPVMDGIELGRRIKQDPAIRGTHLFLLTSIAQRGVAEEARASGFASSLTKPIRSMLLRSSVLSALGCLLRERAIEKPGSVLPSRKTTALADGGVRRVLLAEDNVVNQRVAVRCLERLGIAADVVPTGRDALDVMALNSYDLVLMDCQMPIMDGYEATRELRRREGTGRHTPVIAMTANAMSGDRERCLDAGMDDYLPKPFRIDELTRIVDRWLRSTSEPRTAHTHPDDEGTMP